MLERLGVLRHSLILVRSLRIEIAGDARRFFLADGTEIMARHAVSRETTPACATVRTKHPHADVAIKALRTLEFTAAEARELVASASARVGLDSSLDQLLCAALREIPVPAA